MATSADPELLAVAETLYGGPADAFTPARDAAAKAADASLRPRIKALRRPSVAAWAVNLLVRREADQIDQVLELAAGLRAAAESLDGEELRALTRQRRQLTAALTSSARSLAREYDVKLSEAVADQVEGILTAAMLDPVAAAVVRSGLVLTAFTATGVSQVDVDAVCAVPEALGHRAAAVEPAPPVLTLVSDEAVRRDAARERVHEATIARAAAEEKAEHLARVLERLQARELQLGGEIDELRRRLAALEEQADAVDEEREEAQRAHGDAVRTLAEAVREYDEAEGELAEFE